MNPTFTWGILDQVWHDAIISGFRLDSKELKKLLWPLNCREIWISIRNYLIRLRPDSLSSDIVMWWQTDVCSVFDPSVSFHTHELNSVLCIQCQTSTTVALVVLQRTSSQYSALILWTPHDENHQRQKARHQKLIKRRLCTWRRRQRDQAMC